MSFEEEFDKIIKQKADEAGFPFDEKNWEKVSRQLDAERKGSGLFAGKKLYIVTALFILFSFVGVYMLRETNIDASPLASTTDETGNKPATEKQNSENLPAAEKLTTSVPDNNSKIIKSENSAKIESSVKSEKKFKEAANTTINESARGNAGLSKRTNQAESVPLPAAEEKKTDVMPEIDEPVQGTAVIAPSLAPTSMNETPVSKEEAPVAKTDEAKTVTEHAEEVPEIFKVDELTAMHASLPTNLEEREILPTTFFPMKHHDTEYYKNAKNKLHFLNVEVGTTWLAGWPSKNETDAKGFNWFAGLNYGVYLSRKISIGTGVQLFNISNIKQPFFSGSTTEYGFSSVTSHTSITATSLYYAAVPLKISYIINAQHQIGLGVNMAFLVNANNTIETYNSSPENGNTAIVKTKKMGAYDGIAPTLMQLSAFYKTQVTKRLALNGEFIYGLTDLFKNTLTNKNIENTMGLRLSLQYTLFDK